MFGVCARARARVSVCVCEYCVLLECVYVYNSCSCLPVHGHEFAKGRGMGTEKCV